MVARAQLVRWGNSLAVRIPRNVLEEASLKEGDNLTLEVEGRGAVALRAADRPRNLEDLVAQITPENRHSEPDWGLPGGAEIW